MRQGGGHHIRDAQTRIVGFGVGDVGSAHQAVSQGRRAHVHGLEIVRAKVQGGHGLLHSVNRRMGQATTGKGLVRQLGDVPLLAQLRPPVGNVVLGFKQGVVAIRASEDVLGPSHTGHGQVHRGQTRATVEAHLQAQQHGAFHMRLHGARGLTVLDAKGIHHRGFVQAGQHAQTRHHTKTAAGGGTEKPHHRFGRRTQGGRDLHTHAHGQQKLFTADRATGGGAAL